MRLNDGHHPLFQHPNPPQNNRNIDLLFYLLVTLLVPLHHLELQTASEETADLVSQIAEIYEKVEGLLCILFIFRGVKEDVCQTNLKRKFRIRVKNEYHPEDNANQSSDIRQKIIDLLKAPSICHNIVTLLKINNHISIANNRNGIMLK